MINNILKGKDILGYPGMNMLQHLHFSANISKMYLYLKWS